MNCRCNENYVCDIHDTSPTGKQELFEQMLDDGFAEYQSILEEAKEEAEKEAIFSKYHPNKFLWSNI